MGRRGWIGWTVAIALLAVAGGWVARQRAAPPEGANTPIAARTAREPSVELAASDLATVAPGTILRSIPLTGTLKATQQTLVRAKVAGELKEVAVREGMAVAAGQRLARIDPTEFEWRVKEREAQARSAEAQVEQARRTMENNRQLLQKNFISQNAFDNAQSGFEVAVANRDAALAQLTQARKALADTVVTAPMSGVVAERFVQAGEKVSPDNRLLSIVDLSAMEIEAPVPSAEVGAVRIGQPVSLHVEGIEQPLTGRVVRIAPSTAAGTRSVPVYIGVENRDQRVRAGLFAQGSLGLERRDGVLLVPAAAVRDAGGRSFVYLVEAGRLAERTVSTGLRDEAARTPGGSVGVVEVTEGLRAGDRIVAVNLGALRVGAPVVETGAAGVPTAAPAAPAAPGAPRR
jgi:RND family efflux transporter MFP subunit